jgi:DNA-binding response OmpR family regulator
MNASKRILIVDDDITASRLLELGLERQGSFHVRVENNSTRTLATARVFQPDLIVLDIVMPVVDGGEVAARLRREADLKHLPIIFLTSLVGTGEVIGDTICRGGFIFLPKPANLNKLVACINGLLEHPDHCAHTRQPVSAPAPAN